MVVKYPIKKVLLIIAVTVLFLSAVTAQRSRVPLERTYRKSGSQQLIPEGHWVYDAINFLAMETGIVTDVDSAPLTLQELKICLSEIKVSKLSEAGKNTYRAIENFFDKMYPAISSDAIYISSIPVLKPYFSFQSTPLVKGQDRHFNYYNRPFLFTLPVIFTASDYVTIHLEPYFAQNYATATKNAIFINTPIRLKDVDAQMPQLAYGSAGYAFAPDAFFNIQCGLARRTIGRTDNGSIIMNKTAGHNSYAEFSVSSQYVKYVANVVDMSVYTWDEKTIRRNLYFHRLQFKPFSRFSLAFIEGVLVPGPFEIRFLNPAAIFHSFASWKDYEKGLPPSANENSTGSYFALYTAVNPWKYMRWYGLFAMNQFQTESELSSGAGDIPNSIAFQTGLESAVPIKKGYVTGGAEFVYTSPWMYVLRNNYVSYFTSDKELVSSDSSVYPKNFIGFPQGPDTILFSVRGGYQVPFDWNVSLKYIFMVRGANSRNFLNGKSVYPTTSEEVLNTKHTPTGVPEYSHRLAVTGKKDVFSWLSVNCGIAATFFSNYYNLAHNTKNLFECSVGLELTIP